MSELTINIAKDFSRILGARLIIHGPFSGQSFRENFLENNWDKYDKIKINLDGTEGYPSSFLDESFGYMARIKTPQEVLKKIVFISNEWTTLPKEIKDHYINFSK